MQWTPQPENAEGAAVGSLHPPRPTTADRAGRRGVRSLARLSPAAIRRLAGKPLVMDGQVLAPEMQVALGTVRRRSEPTPEHLGLEEGRRQFDLEAWQFGADAAPVASTQDLTIDGPRGPIPARLHMPAPAEDAPGHVPSAPPLIVYFHGGGFVHGSIASHDSLARFISRQVGAAVMSVGYRLAPEHPFPAGLEDAVAAYGWARENAQQLGCRTAIALAGDSSGGNLAAAVALHARDSGLALPEMLCLLAPWLDLSGDLASGDLYPSHRLFAEGFFLTVEQLEWYRAQLLGGTAGFDPVQLAQHPWVSPLRSEDLGGLPRTHIATAGFDPLRDEGLAFAERLREAGSEVSLHCYRGNTHPFPTVMGVSSASRTAMLEITAVLRAGLDVAP